MLQFVFFIQLLRVLYFMLLIAYTYFLIFLSFVPMYMYSFSFGYKGWWDLLMSSSISSALTDREFAWRKSWWEMRPAACTSARETIRLIH